MSTAQLGYTGLLAPARSPQQCLIREARYGRYLFGIHASMPQTLDAYEGRNDNGEAGAPTNPLMSNPECTGFVQLRTLFGSGDVNEMEILGSIHQEGQRANLPHFDGGTSEGTS